MWLRHDVLWRSVAALLDSDQPYEQHSAATVMEAALLHLVSVGYTVPCVSRDTLCRVLVWIH